MVFLHSHGKPNSCKHVKDVLSDNQLNPNVNKLEGAYHLQI